MDKEIYRKLERKLGPFNENVLRTSENGEPIELGLLREIVETIFIYLGKNGLCGKMYKCRDWLEHDGVLLDKKTYKYKTLKKVLSNDYRFYSSRAGDYKVYNGYFDSKGRWYVRVYIVEKYELDPEEEPYGKFDISISDFHLFRLKEVIETMYPVSLVVENSYEYFDRITVR